MALLDLLKRRSLLKSLKEVIFERVIWKNRSLDGFCTQVKPVYFPRLKVSVNLPTLPSMGSTQLCRRAPKTGSRGFSLRGSYYGSQMQNGRSWVCSGAELGVPLTL